MATIALIWELGSDYGHIGRFLPIAQALRADGHRPVMILRDISRADETLGPLGLEYLQAPLWLPPVKGLPPPINFTETLFLFGFLSPAGLLSVARAWRQLLALLKPDLLVFDHAPTALLATRGLAVPRLCTGNSFALPPRESPMPPYRWWEPSPPRARLLDTEVRLVENANRVLQSLGAPLLRQASDLYQVDAALITGVPELDVYGPRAPENYVGPINNVALGLEPQWPGPRQRRVFAYLKPNYPLFEQAITALARLDASVIVFAPGVARQQVSRLQTPNLAFSDKPLHMGSTRAQCDMAACHAGGMVDVMLGAGRPVLLLPMQMEQTMTSRRVEQHGCGVTFMPDQSVKRLERIGQSILDGDSFLLKAQAFAREHQAYTQEGAVAKLVACCEELLASG
jgi:UDP:flavonoid glycosyltransferase YjiC (YdhE family)